MARNPWAVLVLVVSLLGWTHGAVSATADSVSVGEAGIFIQDVRDELIDLEGRREITGAQFFAQALRAIVSRAFDMEGAARFAAGAFLVNVSPEQREEYSKLYSDWMIERFRNYFVAGISSRISIFSIEALASTGDVNVKLLLPDAVPPALIGARVRRVDGELKIIDFTDKRVSLLRTQRDDFGAVLTARGMAGLLAELRSRVAPHIILGSEP